MNLLQNFHLAVIEYLYRGRRAVRLQTFTTRHSNRKLSIVMTLSTTFTQCAPETTKFGKITQNKGHLAVQGHSRSPFLVPIESSYDFLLVINNNLPPILHCFGDTSFQIKMWKIAILATPLAFKASPPPPDGGVGFPGTISLKFFTWMSMDGQGTKRRRIIAENFNRLSRAHDRYRHLAWSESVCRPFVTASGFGNLLPVWTTSHQIDHYCPSRSICVLILM